MEFLIKIRYYWECYLFSDFKFFFPGIDVGYQLLDNVKAYGNLGYTYRIPTLPI
jgi:hypothetical protein